MFNGILLREFNQKAAAPENKPEEILETLDIQNGMTVADIGSGGGYFTLEFAKRVGKNGLVYAVDINPKNLVYIKKAASKEGLANIATKLAGEHGPELPDNSVAVFFLRNVFHHLSNPEEYFAKLKPILTQGGRIAIIDYKKPAAKNGLSFISIFKHYVSEEIITRIMETAGFHLQQSYGFLPEQSFNIFI